jgi:two-component system nitrate/nitrite response regulator NarL
LRASSLARFTEATIKVHMKSVLQKLHASNRTQAAVWALAKGYGADTHVAAAD